jgi:hypothetical protein
MEEKDNTFPVFFYECNKGVLKDLTGFNFFSKRGFAPDTVEIAVTVEQVSMLKDTISIRIQDLEAEISKSDFSEFVR